MLASRRRLLLKRTAEKLHSQKWSPDVTHKCPLRMTSAVTKSNTLMPTLTSWSTYFRDDHVKSAIQFCVHFLHKKLHKETKNRQIEVKCWQGVDLEPKESSSVKQSNTLQSQRHFVGDPTLRLRFIAVATRSLHSSKPSGKKRRQHCYHTPLWSI